MESEETDIVCSERYGSLCSWPYIRSREGKLHRGSVRGTEGVKSAISIFTSVFLPQGYPESVSEDYLAYQIWDTTQAFASSITGTLAARAVLKGVGVGNSGATVTAASITWILKDGTGMLGRILFAWFKGSKLDCDAKKWRLFADALNDVAIFLEIIAAGFPSIFTLIVCISGVFKSVVGVSGGATRAALTVHQARRDNMADVSAKDGSQETLVNLTGLACSLILTPLISENIVLTYVLYALFTTLHLYANYRAVRSVVMCTLNQARLRLLVRDFLTFGKVPTPAAVNSREPLLPEFRQSLNIQLGAPLNTIIHSVFDYQRVLENNSKNYLLGLNKRTGVLSISLREGADSVDMIQAGFHAEIFQHLLHSDVHAFEVGRPTFQRLQELVTSAQDKQLWDVVAATHLLVDQLSPWLLAEARLVGWITDRNHLGVDEWRASWGPWEGKKGR